MSPEMGEVLAYDEGETVFRVLIDRLGEKSSVGSDVRVRG